MPVAVLAQQLMRPTEARELQLWQ